MMTRCIGFFRLLFYLVHFLSKCFWSTSDIFYSVFQYVVFSTVYTHVKFVVLWHSCVWYFVGHFSSYFDFLFFLSVLFIFKFILLLSSCQAEDTTKKMREKNYLIWIMFFMLKGFGRPYGQKKREKEKNLFNIFLIYSRYVCMYVCATVRCALDHLLLKRCDFCKNESS